MKAPSDIVLRRVLVGHRAAVNVVDFDDKYIVSASGDRTIKVCNVYYVCSVYSLCVCLFVCLCIYYVTHTHARTHCIYTCMHVFNKACENISTYKVQ